MLPLFKRPQVEKKPDLNDAAIALIFASRRLVSHLIVTHGEYTHCICGAITRHLDKSESHPRNCPVADYFKAVDGVYRAVR